MGSFYTKKAHCPNCGQSYSCWIVLNYIDTDELMGEYKTENGSSKIFATEQVESMGKMLDPRQNSTGYFCDYCGNWIDLDDYE